MRNHLALISLLAGASQLAAFFKLWFTARVFGVGSELDAYNLALVLPTLISGVMAGFLQTGLFPVRARLQAEGDVGSLEAFERGVIWLVAGLGLAFAASLAVAGPLLTPLLANSAPLLFRGPLGFAFTLLASLVALNMLGDCAGFLLAMRHRFAIAAGAPILNGLVGGLLLAVWPQGGLTNLVLGTILGVAIQVVICLWGLRAVGLPLVGALLPWKQVTRLGREMVSLGVWILPGVVLSNLVVSLPPLWAASFGEGAVSAFGYAYRLHSSVLQVLVMASTPVILAHFADLVARKETAEVRSILRKAAAASVAIGGLGFTLVWTLGAPALEWIFGGRFDASAASQVASHWWWLTLGLPFALLGNVHTKLWQAQRRPALMSAVAAVSLAALVLGFLLLQIVLGEFSPAAALSISSAATLAIALSITRHGIARRPD